MRVVSLAVLIIVAASPVAAHHPMDGALPTTLLHGLLSGVGHPIIGLDHFAFIVAAGILAGMIARPLVAPLGLIAGALAGAGLHLGAVSLPGAEALIALSVVLAGAAIFVGVKVGGAWVIAAFALAGVFHGYAYAEAIIGAEQGVVTAYLAAFSLTQFGIAVAAAMAARLLLDAPAWARTRQWAGAGLTAAGLMFLAQAAL